MSNSTNTQRPLRPTTWAMERLGYKNRGSFWAFCHAQGVPFIRLNSRACRFDEAAIDAWLASRSVGRAAQ